MIMYIYSGVDNVYVNGMRCRVCVGVCKSVLCSVQYLLEGIRCSVRICE